MLTKFRKADKEMLASVVAWGIPGDIVNEAEKWRGVFGSKRYAACGAKKFLLSAKLKSYKAHVYYKPGGVFAPDFEDMFEESIDPETDLANIDDISIDVGTVNR